jgi:hypothetical protein
VYYGRSGLTNCPGLSNTETTNPHVCSTSHGPASHSRSSANQRYLLYFPVAVHTKQSSMIPLNEKSPPMGPVQRFRNEMKAWFGRLVTVIIERTASHQEFHANCVADQDRDKASVAKNALMGRLALHGYKNARGHPLVSGCPPRSDHTWARNAFVCNRRPHVYSNNTPTRSLLIVCACNGLSSGCVDLSL